MNTTTNTPKLTAEQSEAYDEMRRLTESIRLEARAAMHFAGNLNRLLTEATAQLQVLRTVGDEERADAVIAVSGWNEAHDQMVRLLELLDVNAIELAAQSDYQKQHPTA